MNKQRRLILWMHILSLDSKPTEFLTSLITIGIGLRIVQGKSPVFNQLMSVSDALNSIIPYMGWALICGALSQIFGVIITAWGWAVLGRGIRWLSSVVDGAIWSSMIVFLWLFDTVSWHDSLYAIYFALLINDVWIVMGIAYRGYRGRGAH